MKDSLKLLPLAFFIAFSSGAKGADVNRVEHLSSQANFQVNTASPLSVGYLEVWGNMKMSEAADHYNTLVMAFGEVRGKSVKLLDDVKNTYMDWQTNEWIPNYKKDNQQARDKGVQYVLLSFGGQNNTFDPDTTVDVSVLAKDMVAYAKNMDFDGFDFDLEQVPAGVTEDYLSRLIHAIKAEAKSQGVRTMVITAAPQLNFCGNNTENGGGLKLVNTGCSQIYNQAVASGDFDYLFIQEYNTGSYTVDENGLGHNPGDNVEGAVNQTKVKFIENSFVSLKQLIPEATKIVPGLPANKNAGGAATVYYGEDPSEVYTLICKSYKALKNDSRYGGAMTWSINKDRDTQYQFANSINSSDC